MKNSHNNAIALGRQSGEAGDPNGYHWLGKLGTRQSMGASGWAYFVPYQSDINQALQDLRLAVFRRGEYKKLPWSWRDMTFEEFMPPDPDFTDEDRDDYLVEFERLQALPEPTSPDTLLEWNDTEGTHSIIDIREISSVPDFGVAAPLSTEELAELFSTEQPTRSMIEQKSNQLQTWRGRWAGTYVIAYKDGSPSEIFFTGFSGD